MGIFLYLPLWNIFFCLLCGYTFPFLETTKVIFSFICCYFWGCYLSRGDIFRYFTYRRDRPGNTKILNQCITKFQPTYCWLTNQNREFYNVKKNHIYIRVDKNITIYYRNISNINLSLIINRKLLQSRLWLLGRLC